MRRRCIEKGKMKHWEWAKCKGTSFTHCARKRVLLHWSWEDIIFSHFSLNIFEYHFGSLCWLTIFPLSLYLCVSISKGSILCVDCVGMTTNYMKSSKCTKWCGHRTKDVGGEWWNIISVEFKSIFSHSPRVSVCMCVCVWLSKWKAFLSPSCVHCFSCRWALLAFIHVRQTSSYNFRNLSKQTISYILCVWWVNETHCCIQSVYWCGGHTMAKQEPNE